MEIYDKDNIFQTNEFQLSHVCFIVLRFYKKILSKKWFRMKIRMMY